MTHFMKIFFGLNALIFIASAICIEEYKICHKNLTHFGFSLSDKVKKLYESLFSYNKTEEHINELNNDGNAINISTQYGNVLFFHRKK